MLHQDDPNLLRRYLASELSATDAQEVESRLEADPSLLDSLRVLSQPTDLEKRVLGRMAAEPDSSGLEELVDELKALRLEETGELGDWRPCLRPPRENATAGIIGMLGRYEIISLLAMGGMAYIFKARDPGLDRTVAIKLLAPALAANPSARQRFLREARAAAALEHPHILPIHHISEDDVPPWFVMTLVDGPSLDDMLMESGSAMPEETLLSYLRQIASALELAHSRKLIHRDIKPANILLSEDRSHLWLADFGLVRNQDDPRLTRVGLAFGTPQYMSPEQIDGNEIDGRSDLFSLGAVISHAATGSPPFGGATTSSVLSAITTRKLPSIREARPDLSPQFAAVVDRLLKKNPAERFPNATALLAALSPAARRKTPVLLKVTLVLLPILLIATYLIFKTRDQPVPSSGETGDLITITGNPRAFPDLAAAIASANPGDIIELRGTSRVSSEGIVIPPGKPLAIRALEGSTLTLVSNGSESSFLTSSSDLRLENIRIVRESGTPPGKPLIEFHGNEIHLDHCHISLARTMDSLFPMPEVLRAAPGAKVRISNSYVVAVGGIVLSLGPVEDASSRDGMDITLENNAILSAFPIATNLDESSELSVTINRNVLHSWSLYTDHGFSDLPRISLSADRNVFFSLKSFIWFPGEREDVINSNLSWSGKSNVYCQTPAIRTAPSLPTRGGSVPARFDEFFALANVNEDSPVANEWDFDGSFVAQRGMDSENYTLKDFLESLDDYQEQHGGYGCDGTNVGPR